MGIAVLDTALRFIRVNRVQAELDRLSAEAHLGRRIADALPALPPSVLQTLESVVKTGEPRFGVEISMREPVIGEDRHFQMSFYPVRGPRRRIAGVCYMMRDVTGRRRIQESERRAREWAEAAAGQLVRLQTVTAALSAAATAAEVGRIVLECGRDIVGVSGGGLWWEGNGEGLKLLEASGLGDSELASWRQFGCEVATPFTQAWRTGEVVWPGPSEWPGRNAGKTAAEAGFARRRAEAKPEQLDGRGGAVRRRAEAKPEQQGPEHEMGAVRPTAPGETSWLALPLLARGRSIGALAFTVPAGRRLTPEEKAFALALGQECAQALERARLYELERLLRAEAEAAATLVRRTLRERDESMAVLDALFANAPVGLAVLDRELRFVRINLALAEINGLPTEQHLGRALWEVVPGVASERLVRQLEAVMDTGEPLLDQAVEGETPAAPGQLRNWLGSWFPVNVAGRVIGVGLLVHEVTEQRQAEEFQRQVLGIVSHDLRSPLLAITASASILQHGPLAEREARAVARILHAAGRMDGIIRALTDYSQVRIGRGIPLRLAPADLAEISRSVAEEAEAGHPGWTVMCSAEGDARGEWDADRLGEVLANLVANAVKYGAERVPVRVDCRGDGEHVEVAVRNVGGPIQPDFMPHLFQPFRRGAQATGKTGLGLGLFIARQIALAHGGSLEASSGEEEGTVFTLRLPRRPGPVPQITASSDRGTHPSSPFASRTRR